MLIINKMNESLDMKARKQKELKTKGIQQEIEKLKEKLELMKQKSRVEVYFAQYL